MNTQLKKKKITTSRTTSTPKSGFRPRVRSRHPSHDPLRYNLPKMPFRSVVRLGSTTQEDDCNICCNTPEAVRNSSSKLLMKKCFTKAGVITAPWWTYSNGGFQSQQKDNKGTLTAKELPYPLIVKSLHGSRGNGNSKIDTYQQMQSFIQGKDMSNYIIEQYKSYLREYRLHVTREGCFYTCRKMLKRDTPEEKKFQRHDDNCVWIMETNPDFSKPSNWNAVVADCVKALESLGLDIGAFDLKIQGATDKDGRPNKNPEWIVIESCSAPSFGTVTTERYMQEIPKILQRKYREAKGF